MLKDFLKCNWNPKKKSIRKMMDHYKVINENFNRKKLLKFLKI